MNNKKMLIGYHNNLDMVLAGDEYFDGPVKETGGVDFILCHVDPYGKTMDEECESVKKCVEKIKEVGSDVIINFEGQNFRLHAENTDGHDWAERKDGTHLLNIPLEYMDAINSAGNCRGVMYDEFEHVIINRNVSLALASKFKVDRPAFPTTDSKDPIKQGSLLSGQLKEYSDSIKQLGAETVSGEHVWPVLFHKFAKAGIIPNFKSQKESFSNIQFATAAGAAMQYKTPLWNCVDMWFRMTFPGHTAEEMKHNLMFAYLCGVDLCYVEAIHVFYKKAEDGKNKLTDIGKAYCDFVKEYRGKERNYNVQDYKPEIGIIRYDDSFWGQGRCRFLWRNMLFGNPKIKVGRKSREYIKAWNIITHGETGNGGLSWGRLELHALTKHRSFASMNGAVVFDENVEKDLLSTLKLCFLCGIQISDNTIKAVEELVKDNGLTVVSPYRFAPDEIKNKLKGRKGEVNIGNGKWIVTDNLKSLKLRKQLSPLLGTKGEMSYRFGDREIKMKISENGETFNVIR